MMPGADDVENRTDAGMAVLERDQPGFAQLHEGNPALYARIRAAMRRFILGEIRRDEASRQVRMRAADWRAAQAASTNG